MDIQAITLFPELVNSVTDYGVTGRAVKRELLTLSCINPRDYTQDTHHTVDGRPYGGGPGMVLMIEPLQEAITVARQKSPNAPVIYFSPQGERLTQTIVEELVSLPAMILIAGRYEGIDERLIELEVDRELSLGDYVISGGELAAMTVIDAVVRLLPGALGHQNSASEDSFSSGLLDYPHYTRPESYQGLDVPKVLLSGNHKKIAQWRHEKALSRTYERRPDLLEKLELTESQCQQLKILKENKNF